MYCALAALTSTLSPVPPPNTTSYTRMPPTPHLQQARCNICHKSLVLRPCCFYVTPCFMKPCGKDRHGGVVATKRAHSTRQYSCCRVTGYTAAAAAALTPAHIQHPELCKQKKQAVHTAGRSKLPSRECTQPVDSCLQPRKCQQLVGSGAGANCYECFAMCCKPCPKLPNFRETPTWIVCTAPNTAQTA